MTKQKHYTSHHMLEGAFKFRKAELWNIMYDSDLFGVRLNSGEIAYCTIMGNAGTYYGLGMYRGAKGFSSFLRMINPPQDEMDAMTRVLTYDVINCNFSQANEMNFNLKEPVREFSKKFELPIPRKNGWPEFVRYQPFREMHPVDNEKDGNDIADVLHAGAWLGKMLKTHTLKELGFTNNDYPTEEGGMEIPLIVDEGFRQYHIETTKLPALEDEEFPSPEYYGDTLIDSIRNKKGNGIVEVGTVYMPVVINHNPEHATPFAVPILYKETGYVSGVVCNEPFDEDPYEFLNDIVNTITSNGLRKPACIICTDNLTYHLLRNFCKKAGIMMAQTTRSEDFAQACSHLYDSMRRGF